jgi:A/G-specific adenine glycosylase
MKRWSPEELQKLRKASTKWYRLHRRELPWRATHDPYRIWVSEIMLQQTVVATVIPYYEAFLDTFPDVSTLAAADEQLVLKHWAGLGYYRRAKQLHAAAKRIVQDHDASFPHRFDHILALPGIGRYTAGAIASFAFDQQTPIVEANTQRLFARLLRLKGQLSERAAQHKLWAFAEAILPTKSGSGEINQAVMEIGSQICLTKNPNCSECPLKSLCPTLAAQEQDSIPSPKPAKQYEDRVEAAIIVHDVRLGYLLRLCQPGERWAGLWDFPRFDVTGSVTEHELVRSMEDQFSQRFHRSVEILAETHSLRHAVTRFRITLRCFQGKSKTPPRQTEHQADHRWFSKEAILELPLSSTGKRIAAKLD